MSETLTVARGHPFLARGDYLTITGHEGSRRVTFATATVLTTRLSHRWRWLEWLHARVEDVCWWAADRFSPFTVNIKP